MSTKTEDDDFKKEEQVKSENKTSPLTFSITNLLHHQKQEEQNCSEKEESDVEMSEEDEEEDEEKLPPPELPPGFDFSAYLQHHQAYFNHLPPAHQPAVSGGSPLGSIAAAAAAVAAAASSNENGLISPSPLRPSPTSGGSAAAAAAEYWLSRHLPPTSPAGYLSLPSNLLAARLAGMT